MFNKSYLLDFVFAAIAIGAGLVLAVMLFLIGSSPSVMASELLESNCQGRTSFYLPTELTNEEKLSFSSDAKAFDFLTSEDSWMHVVTDVSISSDRQSADYSATFISTTADKLNFTDLSVILEFSDSMKDDLIENKNAEELNATAITVSGQRSIKDADNLTADLILEKAGGGVCQGIIPNALSIVAEQIGREINAQIKVVKGNQSGRYYFPQGITPIGFASWRDLKPFTEAGLTILKFDRSSRGWIPNPQSAEFFAEPGIGYLAYNPRAEVIEVLSSAYFVPDTVEDHVISKGWNLLYNDTGNDVYAKNILLHLNRSIQPSRSSYPATFSLQDLIETGNADKNILFVPKDYADLVTNFKSVDISANDFGGIIPDGSFYWFYLYDNQVSQEMKDLLFSIKIEGGGDSYPANAFIQFNLVVENKNDFPVTLPDGSQKDPCLVGLEFYDESGKKIESDLDGRNCPAWPKTTLIAPQEKIAYNYSWRPGGKVSGAVTVRAYFDYTRLGMSEMLYNETKINIK